jgi:hypothetical protein
MRKRRWQVEWRTQAKSDGLDRLGQMVKLVIDHAVVSREQQDPRSSGTPPGTGEIDEERSREPRMA